MEAPTCVPRADTTPSLPQSQQGSLGLPSGPGSSQINAEARHLIRGDALQVYRLMCIFRHLPRKEHHDTCVPYASQVTSSRKASGDISERPTTPIYVSVASSDGGAPTST